MVDGDCGRFVGDDEVAQRDRRCRSSRGRMGLTPVDVDVEEVDVGPGGKYLLSRLAPGCLAVPVLDEQPA